jgi:hypothetical protein
MKVQGAIPNQVAVVLAAALFVGAIPGHAQPGDPPSTQKIVASGEFGPPASPIVAGTVLREILDPHLGDRWLLVRDFENPGGPGRLVLAQSKVPSELPGAHSPQPQFASPVIRTGERIILEEHTPHVDAALEAVALGPATPGSVLRVRLQVGGHVVRAIAIRAGHVVLAREMEKQP